MGEASLTLLFVAAVATAPSEPAPPAGELRLRAARAETPPRVDGHLDEPVWAAAPVSSGFRQRDPGDGDPATEATEVRVLFDDDTLYVGISARDREPGKVIGRILERDKIMEQGLDNAARFTGDDVLAFTLDPFHDHRNAFFFATNPNGAEFDALVTDESPTLNLEWRGIWRVAATRTKEGWSAEFAIPLRTLRYPRDPGESVWGFDVERIVRRKNEDTLWSAWSRAEGGLSRVSRAGHLEGLRDLPRTAWNVEVKPFGLARVAQQRDESGRAPTSGEWRAGADAKWEVRPGLVLDATVRPDFAQVEADEEVVHLPPRQRLLRGLQRGERQSDGHDGPREPTRGNTRPPRAGLRGEALLPGPLLSFSRSGEVASPTFSFISLFDRVARLPNEGMIYCHTRSCLVPKTKLAVTLDADLVENLDRLVAARQFANRSQAIESAVAEKLGRLARTRLARECAKLNPQEEKALAEEGLAGGAETWPEY